MSSRPSDSTDADLLPRFDAAADGDSLDRHRSEIRRRLLGHAQEPATAPADTGEDALAIGSTIGRYAVIERIGSGGMGVVLRAYDPKLRREVALKVVRPSGLTEEARARMLREARAMARLAHPNVVALYDVDLDEAAGVVVAMELVRGQTLHDWLEHRRSWAQLQPVFVAAGRGLAAAHDAGVLHRDFKPGNVLVADDGRVQVTDFGLARTSTVDATPGSPPEYADEAAMTASTLTGTGTILGTPIYMAPEQHDGVRLTTAADQYAFCVSLWEAIAGAQPYAGAWKELIASKRRGPPSWPPGAPCPKRVVEAVVRGLAPDPVDRWPSMHDLLRRLSRDARVARRSVVVVVAVAVAVAVAVTVATFGTADWLQHRAQLCAGADAALADVWTPLRRDAVEQAILGLRLPFAPGVWSRTSASLDAYSQQWTAAHREACEATTVREEQPAAVMDRRMACLYRAKMDFRAAVDLLVEGDVEIIERAHELVDALPGLHRCEGVEVEQVDVPPGHAEAALAIEDKLARTRALRHGGRYEEALAVATEAREDAAHVAVEHLVVEADLELAPAQATVGDFVASEASYRRALMNAVALDSTSSLVRAATGLLQVVGVDLRRPEEAMLLAGVALGAVERSGEPADEADVRDALGTVLRALGRLPESEAEHRAALALRGSSHLLESTRNNLGIVLLMQGRYAEAETEYRAALQASVQALGADHPTVALMRNNLAIALQRMGKEKAASIEYEHALATAESALGGQHPTTVKIEFNFASLLLDRGEYVRATAALRRVLKALEVTYGPAHPDVGSVHQNLGTALQAQGDHAGAVREQRAAVSVLERALGPDHAEVGYARGSLGYALHRAGEGGPAVDELQAAVEIVTRALGPEHQDVADVRNNLGAALVDQGRYAEAEVEHRAVLEIRERGLGPEHPLAAAALHNFGLAMQLAGELDAAEQALRDALARLEHALPPGHPEITGTALALGELLLERGGAREAGPYLERAWASAQQGRTPPEIAADSAFALARASWRLGVDRDRARSLAEDARQRFVQLGATEADRLDRVDAWLRTHR